MDNLVLIKRITDADFGLKAAPFNNPQHRYASRGVIFKGDQIALFYSKITNYYKLIGGGIEDNETPTEAFHREALEESGYRVDNVKLVGTFEEEKSRINFLQTSYVFIAKAVGKPTEPILTQKEIERGLGLVWVNKDKGLDLLKNPTLTPNLSEESLYNIGFMAKRDYEIVKYCLSKIQ